jgi:hypothetical protein
MEYVASHQGAKDAASIGNEKADGLANRYRKLGEAQSPQLYFTLNEEKVILRHRLNNLQGGVRGSLKEEIEKEMMLKEWTSLKTQGRLAKKFPTQILKQAKRVWTEAIVRNEGSAWVRGFP